MRPFQARCSVCVILEAISIGSCNTSFAVIPPSSTNEHFWSEMVEIGTLLRTLLQGVRSFLGISLAFIPLSNG